MNNFVSQAVNESFSGLWILVAEWRDVHPYPHGSIDESDSRFTFANMVSNA